MQVYGANKAQSVKFALSFVMQGYRGVLILKIWLFKNAAPFRVIIWYSVFS